jgi:hypothetical protein
MEVGGSENVTDAKNVKINQLKNKEEKLKS